MLTMLRVSNGHCRAATGEVWLLTEKRKPTRRSLDRKREGSHGAGIVTCL
jgi:hypothetical protein